jgi:HK97 family phage portal protein
MRRRPSATAPACRALLSHPEAIGEEAAARLQKDFKNTYSGADKAGTVAVLEEGLKWQQISVSPDDAQMLESRKFSTMALARIFRVPPPVIGEFEGGNYSSVSEIGRWFYSHCMMPWLNKWERLIEHSLLSAVGRRNYEFEFDCDLILRGDMLTRFQAYRIARETGIYNANELRKFEKQNPRTDAAATSIRAAEHAAHAERSADRRSRRCNGTSITLATLAVFYTQTAATTAQVSRSIAE